MHALPFDKHLAFLSLETVDNRELLVARISDVFECVVSLYVRNKIVVRYRTGDFAGTATDAPGCINENANELFAFFCAGRPCLLYG